MDLGDGERGLTLTTEGRDLLDSHSMERDREPSQMFYTGVSRSRQMDHDSNLYATVRQEEARLRDEHPGVEIRRVILEQDLKREYLEFLQDHNRNRSDSDGQPSLSLSLSLSLEESQAILKMQFHWVADHPPSSLDLPQGRTRMESLRD